MLYTTFLLYNLTTISVVSSLSLTSSSSSLSLSLSSSLLSSSSVNDGKRISSRSQFLKTAIVFAATTSSFVTATEPVCAAVPTSTSSSSSSNNNNNNNPRYIQSEVQMKYANGPNNNNPRTRGILVRRYTGDNTPYTFPIKPVSLVKEWPTTSPSPPFQPEDFLRADQQDDGSFYAIPRFVYHIDEPAVSALTQYYRNNIPQQSSILDICSSWVSHYPLEFPNIMKRISATGMNVFELKANDQLSDYQVKDLNIDYTLPYDNESFDIVTCVVSIDYLIQPIEVLKEVHRVLKPGGKIIISQSNRCFPSKAIAMWLKMNDRQHLELINAYLQYAGGFLPRKAFDITAKGSDGEDMYNDPMFIVEAIKA